MANRVSKNGYNEGVRSTASIAGHPLHPMVVPFPIAFLVGTLVTDIVYLATGDPFWARMSLYLVGAGLVMGAIAAILGLTDFFTIRRVRSLSAGWIHFLGNAAALLLSLANVWIRAGSPAAAVLPAGIILSAVTTAILGVTGWMGGELSYRYEIGVVGTESETGSGGEQETEQAEERFRRAA